MTVTRRSGQGSPLESRAARTRSRDSRRGVGQTDDGEAREAVGDVNLDRDRPADGPVQRGGGDGREHAEERSHRPSARAPAKFVGRSFAEIGRPAGIPVRHSHGLGGWPLAAALGHMTQLDKATSWKRTKIRAG